MGARPNDRGMEIGVGVRRARVRRARVGVQGLGCKNREEGGLFRPGRRPGSSIYDVFMPFTPVSKDDGSCAKRGVVV